MSGEPDTVAGGVVATSASEVLRVLDAFGRAGIPAGITGGWGIDALLGRQTRPHGDVDLGVPTDRLADAIGVLRGLGYAVSRDERPARVALRGDRGAVDLHPIAFDSLGNGVQTGFDGQRFDYPAGSLEHPGVIDGRPVACGSPALQLAFHLGYAPRDHDRADMQLLAEAFGFDLPADYLRS